MSAAWLFGQRLWQGRPGQGRPGAPRQVHRTVDRRARYQEFHRRKEDGHLRTLLGLHCLRRPYL